MAHKNIALQWLYEFRERVAVIFCSADEFFIGSKANKPLSLLYYCNVFTVFKNIIRQAEYSILSRSHMHFTLGELLGSSKVKA